MKNHCVDCGTMTGLSCNLCQETVCFSCTKYHRDEHKKEELKI